MSIQFETKVLEEQVKSNPRLTSEYERLRDQKVASIYVTSKNDNLALSAEVMTSENYDQFELDGDAKARAIRRLEELGFTILYPGRFAIVVSGSADLYQNLFGVRFTVKSRSLHEIPMADELLVEPDSLEIARSLTDAKGVPGVRNFWFEEPAQLHKHPAPDITDDQLDAAGMCTVLGVPPDGGAGVRFGIADTAFEINHPVLRQRELTTTLLKTTPQSPTNVDVDGHGTAMLALASAIAPRAHFVLASTVPCEYAAVEAIVKQNVKVLSCSWGWHEHLAKRHFNVQLAVFEAIAKDVVVVFASGNKDKNMNSWPAALRGVLAVGGVHVMNGRPTPSPLTSSFRSMADRDRIVPDICGLAGGESRPYVLVPVPKGCDFDKKSAGESIVVKGDGTPSNDGWAFSSHSSGATAQVAAVAAVVRAKKTGLKAPEVEALLKETALDSPPAQDSEAERSERSRDGFRVTGAGLVNAAKALE
jgi:hypothetical protein